MKESWVIPFGIITLLLIRIRSDITQAESSSDCCQKYESLQNLEVNQPPANQPYRTSYHFQPPRNWLNDPNGPMYYKGAYHLFYQYNPSGPLFGDIMIWAHSVSFDLINWIQLENALCPSDSFDINSCWSGSTTILPGGKPVILYTGIDSNNHQVQNLAEPKNLSDPLLREWVKFSNNPLMVPPEGIETDSFRDPTTAWQGHDGKWRVIVGARNNGTKGMALLYRSDDFLHWSQFQDPFYSSEVTGMWECPDFYPVLINSTNGIDTSVQNPTVRHVREPGYKEHDYYILGTYFPDTAKSGIDFYPTLSRSTNEIDTSVQNPTFKHVLKAGYKEHDYYVLGTYFPDTEKFVSDSDFTGTSSDLRYDYGKFYASKTFFDSAKNRRILWGWVNESDSREDDIEKGWSGLQTVPRQVWLNQMGNKLIQWPVEEIKKLRTKEISLNNKKLEDGSLFEVAGITASQADVEVAFELLDLKDAEFIDTSSVDPQQLCNDENASANDKLGPFGLLALASKDLSEQTAIFFRVLRHPNGYQVLMCSDHSRSSLKTNVDKTTYGAFLDIDPRHEKISLRCLIDHSIIESFGGEGRSVITSRVYPKLAVDEEAHLYVFNNGSKSVLVSSLRAWSMSKAQINSRESSSE